MARYAVLGGGALGLTVALRLLQRGDEVVLYEREEMPGGLAAGFKVGPSYLEKFYHHLFRSDRHAIRLIEEMGLADKLVWPRPKTSVLRDGRIWQFDSATSVLKFGPLLPIDRVRLGAAVAYLRAEPNYSRLSHVTAAAWIERWMGRGVYETLWKPLLRSKFGERYTDIAMPWFWARIHYRSPSLGYIRGGFQQLYDALAHQIRRLGGETRFGMEVREIATVPQAVRIVAAPLGGSEHEERFDRVVSTLATRLTLNLTPELPESYWRQYSNVEAYGAHCLILGLDRRLTNDVYWLNINDPGFPFLALVEHTNYMPPADYGGRHLVYLGNYLPMNNPLFRMSTDEIKAAFLPHLRSINPAFEERWVTDAWSFGAPYAQPIVTRDFVAKIPPHATPLPNLFLANMFQVYPQDRGQNYSIALAERLVREVLS